MPSFGLFFFCFFASSALQYDDNTSHASHARQWETRRRGSGLAAHKASATNWSECWKERKKTNKHGKTVSQDYSLQSACLHVAEKLMEISEPWIWSKLGYYFTTALHSNVCKKNNIYNGVFRIRHQLWFQTRCQTSCKATHKNSESLQKVQRGGEELWRYKKVGRIEIRGIHPQRTYTGTGHTHTHAQLSHRNPDSLLVKNTPQY